MARQTFSDFDEFADAIRGIAGRFVPTARSQAEWWVESWRIGRLDLQHLQVGGAATYAGDGTSGTLTIGIPRTDPKRIRIDGHALGEDSLVFIRRNQPFTFAAREVTRWAAVTIGLHYEGSSAVLLDPQHVLAAVDSCTRARIDPRELERLRQLVERVGSADGSVGFHDPAASDAAEQELLLAVMQTIDASTPTVDRHVGRPQVSRRRVIARTLALIDASQGKPLFIDDVCRATDVSERTLRNIFYEYFGVGPMRLLKVRQLMEIRAALLAGDPAHDTVTRIAAGFGVWDFSLFARNYKALFGESPSVSLRRRPTRRIERIGASWIGYAARMFAPFEVQPSVLHEPSVPHEPIEREPTDLRE